LLEKNGVAYRYRDYRKEPLNRKELQKLFRLLDLKPGELLRRRDRAFRELGLTGEESTRQLIDLMSEHPTLLQRPIGVLGEGAVVGRPPEKLLELA
jgi:arsenate reductase